MGLIASSRGVDFIVSLVTGWVLGGRRQDPPRDLAAPSLGLRPERFHSTAAENFTVGPKRELFFSILAFDSSLRDFPPRESLVNFITFCNHRPFFTGHLGRETVTQTNPKPNRTSSHRRVLKRFYNQRSLRRKHRKLGRTSR